MENLNKLDPAVTEKISELTVYINDLMSDISTLESVMEKKMLKLTELTEQEQQLKETLVNDNEKLKSELLSLEKSKAEVEKSITSLQESITSLEDIQQSMSVECGKLQEEKSKVEEEYERLQKEKDKTKEEFELLQKEKDKTKEEFEQIKAESTKVIEENKEELEGIQVEKKATEKILTDKLNHLSALNEKIQNASVKFKRHAVFITINLVLIVITLYVLPSSELFTMKYLFVGVLVAVAILGTVTIYNIIALVGELSRLINAILENQ